MLNFGGIITDVVILLWCHAKTNQFAGLCLFLPSIRQGFCDACKNPSEFGIHLILSMLALSMMRKGQFALFAILDNGIL
jgi:hypothetical protein